MKRRYNSFTVFILLTLLISFIGCDDVFEEDISDDVITLISPISNSKVSGNSVNLRWSNVEGADNYRVQITNANNFLVIDSLSTVNNLNLPISSGEYEWRVRGENFAYNTAYSFSEKFTIENTNDLTNQDVFLLSPSDNYYSNNSSIILTWEQVNFAEYYSIQIEKKSNNIVSTVLEETDITSTSYSIDASVLDDDAEYTWKISALNENSQTSFFSRTILIDTQSPNIPNLISPANEESVNFTVNFSWEIATDIGEVESPVQYVLEIATDENFTNIINIYSISETAQQHTFNEQAQYYWRVKSLDQAGNQSQYSNSRYIIVE